MTFDPKEPRDKAGKWSHLTSLVRKAAGHLADDSHGNGFTVNLNTGEEPTKGFAVAMHEHSLVLDHTPTSKGISEYARSKREHLTAEGGHLGGWLDKSEGKTYLDVSKIHPDFNTSLAHAKTTNELALYDLEHNREYHSFVGDWQGAIDGAKGRDLVGHPPTTNVPGHGTLRLHSSADIQRVAAEYNKAHGLEAHPTDYSSVDPARAAEVAKAYEAMKHEPNNPEVKSAYDALKSEVLQQHDALVANGYSFNFYPQGGDPYSGTPHEAIHDVAVHKKLSVFPTLGEGSGFGAGEGQAGGDHPMLELVPGLKWEGRDVTYNDVFRAVHDTFTHAKEGIGFDRVGEDNTYRQHASMFSPLARKAIATETRGQNTTLNFGSNSAHNHADPDHPIFPDQKAGILPEKFIDPEYLSKNTEADIAEREKAAKEGKDLSTDWISPNAKSTIDLAQHEGKLAFWKMILPRKRVEYTAQDGSRKHVDFDRDYLVSLASNRAVDKIGFLLADKDNAHTMDPERWRGEVAELEVRDDGLYGKIVFGSPEAAQAVLANPDLGVSARIREHVPRSDGTVVPRGLIHVLGTLDPQVSGMTPWVTADLSNVSATVDLTTKEYTSMPKTLSDYTEADVDKMTEAELDAFLAEFADGDPAEDAEADGAADTDKDADKDEAEKAAEAEAAKIEAAKAALVGAGADLSNPDLNLANTEIASARALANEALRRMADAEWKERRASLLADGVPPAALDLAAVVLNRPSELMLDLSNSGEADVNVSGVVAGMLDLMRGTIDLSGPRGYAAGADEDTALNSLLDRWSSQFD